MGILLSLVTAALYGSADFCGGLAAARERTSRVLLGAHAIGLVGIAVVAWFAAEQFSWRDAGLGAAGGLWGLVGVLLLYRRLAEGPMHVVAPLSGVMSAATPALWGVAGGERLSGGAWVGVVLALGAIVLVSVGSERSGAPVTPRVIVESLLSGIGFGAFFVFLAETTDEVAPWPVASARLTTVCVLLVVVVLVGRADDDGRPATPRTIGLWGLIAWAGLADTGANATFLFATQHGDLAVVSVLSSLYPLSTVLLARVILGDRMSPRQFAGLAAAIAGTALIIAN